MAAFMLSMTAANAQTVIKQGGDAIEAQTLNGFKAPAVKAPLVTMHSGVSVKAPVKAPMKAELTENQKALGLQGSDDPYTSVGVPNYAGKVTRMASYLSTSDYSAYVGAKVVGIRFAVTASIGSNKKVFIMENTSNGVNQVATGSVPNTLEYSTQDDQGVISDFKWNTVMFDTPYTLTAASETLGGIFFGYEYTQKSAQNDDASYPIVVGIGTSSNGVICYGDLEGTGSNWYGLSLGQAQDGSTVYGSICMQLILEKDGGFIDDIVMDGVATPQFISTSENGQVMFACKNLGSKSLTDYDFSLYIDGDESKAMTLTPNQPLGGTSTYFNATFPTEGLGVGLHTLTVKVKSMNGGEPTGNLDDDAASTQFRMYTYNSTHQQTLIEHFTSQFCSNCHYGYDLLRTMTEGNNDYAWVAIHGDMTAGKDVYTIEDGNYITNYSTPGYPYANLDRGYFGDGYLGVGLGYDTQYHSQVIEEFKSYINSLHDSYPALVRLNLSGNYDAANNKYTVTVTGTGVEKASIIIPDYTLSLYVTESGLKGRQNNDGKWSLAYSHENVLRAVVSEPWGDEIKWDGDNFTKTFEFDVDDAWNADNLTAVAFLSKPFVFTASDGKSYYDSNIDAMAINQCQSIKLSTEGSVTGVNGVENAQNATVVARFAADGTQVSAPVKGLNIIKLSDGTTRKVVLK